MWSDWMPIQAYGYTGPKPYATFGPDVVRYATTWQRPEWRYDPAAGYVEYAGLCKLNANKAGAFELVINYMDPTPAIPKLPANGAKRHMITGMTNMGDVSWGHPTRYDMATMEGTWPGSHHHIWWSMGTVAPVAGRWFWLNTVQSFSDSDPDWYPWRKVLDNWQTEIDGATVYLGSNFTTSYSAMWDAELRFTKDYKRWQWQGLLRNTAPLSASPYNIICNIVHPNPQTLGNCLNTSLTEGAWAGGSAQPYRLDNRQHAGGHRLDVVAATTTYNPSWMQVRVDYFTRT